jgi:alkanesulfonate monooxygenase SsuD/methylene tetrahydromethanopterin reductase-like flavin-dependent oxidoreductase (luciferase family)
MELGLLTLGDHLADPATGIRTPQSQRHREILEYLAFAEPAGFDAVIVGEHHFSDFIISVPQVFLAWVAARTSTVRLATGVTLLPHHDPVRLAEDFATLDVVSEGRAELWVGKGVEPYVYRQFGQDVTKVNAMQDEGLRLLLKLWSERDVSWKGEFRPPLDSITVEPRPIQQPHPPVFVACSSVIAAEYAASLGLGITITLLSCDRPDLSRIVSAYRDAWAEFGHTHGPRVTLNAHVHVAPTTQEARKHIAMYQFGFQRWVNSKKTGVPADQVKLAPRITDLDNLGCSIISGSPNEVIDRIGTLTEYCEFDRFTYQGDHGGQPWPLVKRSLDLFAARVIPTLSRANVAMAATG